MAVLQIVSNRAGVGKTCLAGALLTHFGNAGQIVAYYKPLALSSTGDADLNFLSGYLSSRYRSATAPAAHEFPPESNIPEQLLADLSAEAVLLAGAVDQVVVESANPPGEGDRLSIAAELAPALGSRAILVCGYSRSLTADSVMDMARPFGDQLLGVLINGVSKHRVRETRERLENPLKDQGVHLLGILAEDRTMLAVSVQEIADHLGGQWVQEPVNTDALVERFLIGGNIMDAGSTYFGRFPSQAVVTRAARPDIQMASLMEDTRCLVLTGGSQPTDYVKAEALQRDVALILVEDSTMDTADALGTILSRTTAHSPSKVRKFLELLNQSSDLSSLTSALH